MRSRILLAGLVLAFAATARAADYSAYLPNDSEVVISLNFEQLLSSPLGKKYLRSAMEQGLKDNPQAQEIFKALNFDPFKDVSRVTIAVTDTSKEDGLVIVNGKFSREKVEAALAQASADPNSKMKIHKAGTATVYEMTGDNNKPFFSGFASSGVILVGPKLDSVKAALGGSGLGKPKKELAALFPKADKQTVWMAMLPKVASAAPLPDDQPDLKKAVEGLEGISGTLNVDTTAKLNVTLTSKTPQATQAAGQQVLALVNLGKTVGPGLVKDQPALAPLLDLLNSIRVAANQKRLTISAEMSGPAIEKLIEEGKKGK